MCDFSHPFNTTVELNGVLEAVIESTVQSRPDDPLPCKCCEAAVQVLKESAEIDKDRSRKRMGVAQGNNLGAQEADKAGSEHRRFFGAQGPSEPSESGDPDGRNKRVIDPKKDHGDIPAIEVASTDTLAAVRIARGRFKWHPRSNKKVNKGVFSLRLLKCRIQVGEVLASDRGAVFSSRARICRVVPGRGRVDGFGALS